MNDPTISAPIERSSFWEGRVPWLLGGLIAGAAIILVNHVDYGGLAEWGLISIVGSGIAAAIFWKRHRRWWYWASIALILTVQITLLLWSAPQLIEGPKSPVMKGGVALVTVSCCVWFWWMGWLFEPHQKARTSTSIIAEIVLYGWALVVLVLVVALWWGITLHAKA